MADGGVTTLDPDARADAPGGSAPAALEKADEPQARPRADGGADGGADRGTAPDKPAPKRRSRRGLFIFAAIAAAVAAGIAVYTISTAGLVSTDDAFTDGFTVSMAPQVSGQVTELAVKDNQFVHKGDVLIRIDPRPFEAARDAAQAAVLAAQGQYDAARFASDVAKKNFPAALQLARAQLQAAQATLTNAEQNARRQHAVPRSATTQQDIDSADAALRTAQAQVAQAEAQVQQAAPVEANIGETSARADQQDAALKQAQADLKTAELNLEWSVVRAPQDGWVTKRGVNQGDYVSAGQNIMTLVTPTVWVTANFKENQLDRMRPGQKVSISVDAYPELKLSGHVDSIQLGSGSKFTAFPAENATGNFVKIVQRVPVKIDIDGGTDPDQPLPLGISVVPTVTVK